MRTIDLNSDLGEGLGPDVEEEILRTVSSANVACGAHAGDEDTMRATVRFARAAGVRVGAHPGYPDRDGFGRLHMDMSVKELVGSLTAQIGALRGVCEGESVRVAYLKPHGALYNDAVSGDEVAMEALMKVAGKFRLPMMMLPKARLARWAGSIIREGFLDRAVKPDGTLVPRGEVGALITDPDEVAAHALRLAPDVDSLSVHSDTPGAATLVARARSALEEAGYTIAARA